jgi:hypothetical protein
MTIQSRMNKRVQCMYRWGLTPSEWAVNLSKKTSKEINKNLKPNGSYQLPGSHANAAKHLCHRAGLSLALTPRKFRICKPKSHNHRRNVNNFKNYSIQI